MLIINSCQQMAPMNVESREQGQRDPQSLPFVYRQNSFYVFFHAAVKQLGIVCLPKLICKPASNASNWEHPLLCVRTETVWRLAVGRSVCITGDGGKAALQDSREEWPWQEEKIPCSRRSFTLNIVTCLKQMYTVNKTLIKPCRRLVNYK